MTDPLEDILALLRPVSTGPNRYLGPQPDDGVPRARVYGGQVAAQAALAAADTVSGRRLHSLHVTFLRPGDPALPLRYEVTPLRDGRTLSTRRVTATQDGRYLMEAMASFIEPMDGHEFAARMPDVAAPESLRTAAEWLAPEESGPHNATEVYWMTAFDLRYADPPPLRSVFADPDRQRTDGDALCRVWLRVAENPPAELLSDPLLATGLLIYLTDWAVLDAVQVGVGRSWKDMFTMASLDHALWFHRPADFSDWLLFDHRSPSASGGTGLARGDVFNRDGSLVCTVAQEGYFGPR